MSTQDIGFQTKQSTVVGTTKKKAEKKLGKDMGGTQKTTQVVLPPSQIEAAALKKLEKKLGYHFQNKALLKQALTRQSAIEEKLPEATQNSYQALEFLGDAAIKFALARLIIQKNPELTEAELHDKTTALIGNKEVLPEIAEKLQLPNLLLRGAGEAEVTQKMKADVLEAVIGAISLDNESQKAVMQVIGVLWSSYLSANTTTSTVSQIPQPSQNIAMRSNSVTPAPILITSFSGIAGQSTVLTEPSVPEPKVQEQVKTIKGVLSNAALASSSSEATNSSKAPMTPAYNLRLINNAANTQKQAKTTGDSSEQRVFCALRNSCKINKFEEYLSKVSDINCRNIGKKGDTFLMVALRNPKIGDKDLLKIKALLKRGASWETQNNKGETANDLVETHPCKDAIIQLREETAESGTRVTSVRSRI